jgi:hypothetical protein
MATAGVGARLSNVPNSTENGKVGVADRESCGISEVIRVGSRNLNRVDKWTFRATAA